MLFVSYLKIFCLLQGHEGIVLCYLLEAPVLPFTFRTAIHLELIFVYDVKYFNLIFVYEDTQSSTIYFKKCHPIPIAL